MLWYCFSAFSVTWSFERWQNWWHLLPSGFLLTGPSLGRHPFSWSSRISFLCFLLRFMGSFAYLPRMNSLWGLSIHLQFNFACGLKSGLGGEWQPSHGQDYGPQAGKSWNPACIGRTCPEKQDWPRLQGVEGLIGRTLLFISIPNREHMSPTAFGQQVPLSPLSHGITFLITRSFCDPESHTDHLLIPFPTSQLRESQQVSNSR